MLDIEKEKEALIYLELIFRIKKKNIILYKVKKEEKKNICIILLQKRKKERRYILLLLLIFINIFCELLKITLINFKYINKYVNVSQYLYIRFLITN